MKNNRLLITLLSLLFIYTIVGFVAIPKILKPQLENIINDNITQKATIEKLEFNPYLLKVSLVGLKIKNKDLTTFSLDKATLDFALLKSLDEKHINFKKLELVKPYIHIIQEKDGSYNLEKLAKTKNNNTSQEEKKESSTLAFQLYKTVLEDAKIEFTKKSKDNDQDFNFLIDKLNYTFYDMGTFKNSLASHSLSMKINKNTDLKIKGGLRLNPFEMYGNATITNLKPTELTPYAKDLINFELNKDSYINLAFGYQVVLNDKLNIEIDNANLSINKIDVKQDSESLLSFNSFNINNLTLKYPQNSLSIDSVLIDNINSNIKRDKKGVFNFSNLIKEDKSSRNTPKGSEKSNKNIESKPWSIALKEFKINNSNFNYKDDFSSFYTKTSGINLNLDKLNIQDKDMSLEDLALFIKDSKLTQNPNEIKISNIDLKVNKSNIQGDKILIDKVILSKPDISLIDSKANRRVDARNIFLKVDKISTANGSTKVDKVNLKEPIVTLKDRASNTNIIAKNIDIDINKIAHKDNSLKVSNSSVKKPYFEITLGKQKEQKSDETKSKKEKSTTKDKSNFNFDIGPLKIVDMRMIFQDKNLPLPFKTDVTKLNGEFSRLNSSSSKPTKLSLEGQVDKYGYTKITGTVDINDIKLLTNTNIIFKNIAIKNFTPYSGKFVGREIDAGKLNLDLKYNIKKSNLDAKNSVIISDIKLGKNVKSPEAVNLPLEFAIALLEDSNGVIDIDLPIKGNVDDPQFSVAPIVWKAFTNLIVKAVTAPFSLLASLFGFDEEKLKGIDFEYGSSSIIASEKESLDAIATILEKKPKLAVNIEPLYNSINDTKALQDKQTETLINKEMKEISKGDKYILALEKLYLAIEDNNKKDITEIKDSFTKKDKDKKSYFDKEEYALHLKEYLASKQQISKKELITLVNSRINSIKEYLLIVKKIPKEALNFKEPSTSSSKKDKWLTFKITLSTK